MVVYFDFYFDSKIDRPNNWFLYDFCRSQMQTIITKACKELGIKPIPSKRVCAIYFAL